MIDFEIEKLEEVQSCYDKKKVVTGSPLHAISSKDKLS